MGLAKVLSTTTRAPAARAAAEMAAMSATFICGFEGVSIQTSRAGLARSLSMPAVSPKSANSVCRPQRE